LQLGDKEKALVSFRALEKEPASPQRLKAIQKIGSIELSKGNYEQAIPYLETSSQNARTKIEEAEALEGLVLAYFQTQKHNQVISTAERLEKLDGILPQAKPKALLFKAKSQLALGRRDAAEISLAILVDGFKTVQGAEGLFLLADSYRAKGQIEQSNNAIFDLSGPFVDFDYWYGRMFILLAENYIQSGESFQAKATLESIVENTPNAEIKSMAQAKLQNLK